MIKKHFCTSLFHITAAEINIPPPPRGSFVRVRQCVDKRYSFNSTPYSVSQIWS